MACNIQELKKYSFKLDIYTTGTIMSRYSIFGYYGHGNAGDEAILSALINGIKKNITDAKIVAYSADPQETRLTHEIESYKFFSLDPISFIKGVIGRSRKNYISSLINFIKTDIVIIGGGGIFFDTPQESRWLFGYTNLIKTAKKFNKKVAIVGVSIGPVHNTESEKAITDAFRLVDLISVRDCKSKELLNKYYIDPEKVHIIPDLVFTLESCPASRVESILLQENLNFNVKKTISLTPCCYNKNKQGWIDQYVSFCQSAIKELGANIVLIPMQRNGTHNDHEAALDIFNSLDLESQKHTFVLQGTYAANEIQGVLSRSHFILAERLHGSIMAINTGTPFASIAYMPKVDGVLSLAKLNDRKVTMEDFLSGIYKSRAINFIQFAEQDSEKLLASMKNAKSEARRIFKQLKDI